MVCFGGLRLGYASLMLGVLIVRVGYLGALLWKSAFVLVISWSVVFRWVIWLVSMLRFECLMLFFSYMFGLWAVVIGGWAVDCIMDLIRGLQCCNNDIYCFFWYLVITFEVMWVRLVWHGWVV